MTFDEWWGGDRDRTLAYDLMKVLSEAARQAWDAATKAAQPQWRPMTAYRAEPEIVALRSRARPGGRYVLGPLVKDPNGGWAIRVSEMAVVHFPRGEFIGWMPLPPPPEKTE